MTPAARLQAAIEILDQILDGDTPEKVLTGWARGSRYAGSKDRAAVRDHVFTALRCQRSHAALGGANSGRGLILGALRESGIDPEPLFSGAGYGPEPLTEGERDRPTGPSSVAEQLDIPDWLWPQFAASLGDKAEVAAAALRVRAPVYLRANRLRGTVDQAIEALAEEGVICASHPAADCALEVSQGARRLRNCEAYQTGLVELQDGASQAVVEALPLDDDMRVLDYCAGGGGKTLAMAARAKLALFAHDAAPRRMLDLPLRADRAGVDVTVLQTEELERQPLFNLVLCDAPCSGSGSWRRSPEGKWRLTAELLAELQVTQAEILHQASALVAPNGVLAYATCSMLDNENTTQVQSFIEQFPNWKILSEQAWAVQNGTDGFYLALLTRVNVD